MSERSSVWDGVLIGDSNQAPYSAAEWAARQNTLRGIGSQFPNYGVIKGTGSSTYEPLSVQAKSPASANVEVEIGSALVAGYLYQNSAAVTLAIGSNASGNPRIDTVVLRADFVAQTIRAVVKQGTPAGSPVRAALQQDTSIWEIPLADVAVANGFTTLAQTTITNRQRAIHSIAAGWQPIAYPMNAIINGNYDASSITFPGVSVGKSIPFTLTSNMLLNDVVIRHITTVVNYTINWGIYFEDLNDGNTAENSLRLVASGSKSGTTAGTENIVVPAIPAPQILTPGTYWLVIQLSSFTGAGIAIGAINLGGIDDLGLGHRQGGAVAGTMPSTLNMVTGWTTADDSLAVRMRGRVFGMSTGL